MAVVALRKTVFDLAHAMVEVAREVIASGSREAFEARREELVRALATTHDFVESLRDLDDIDATTQARHVDAIHALDYLEQLLRVLSHAPFTRSEGRPSQAEEAHAHATETLEFVWRWLEGRPPAEERAVREDLERIWEASARARKDARRRLFDEVARGGYAPAEASRDIESIRRLDEVTFHLYRFTKRMSHSRGAQAPEGPPAESR